MNGPLNSSNHFRSALDIPSLVEVIEEAQKDYSQELIPKSAIFRFRIKG
jgi:hypothetical protein